MHNHAKLGKVKTRMSGFGIVHEVWEAIARQSGEGNGTPLQYSCLENPMGGGAW